MMSTHENGTWGPPEQRSDEGRHGRGGRLRIAALANYRAASHLAGSTTTRAASRGHCAATPHERHPGLCRERRESGLGRAAETGSDLRAGRRRRAGRLRVSGGGLRRPSSGELLRKQRNLRRSSTAWRLCWTKGLGRAAGTGNHRICSPHKLIIKR